jgi:hypothetical protein
MARLARVECQYIIDPAVVDWQVNQSHIAKAASFGLLSCLSDRSICAHMKREPLSRKLLLQRQAQEPHSTIYCNNTTCSKQINQLNSFSRMPRLPSQGIRRIIIIVVVVVIVIAFSPSSRSRHLTPGSPWNRQV